MNNSIYVLGSGEVKVEKFHLCTWDVRSHNTYVEVGVSLANDAALVAGTELYLVLPFLTGKSTVTSLHENLHDSDNYKFIFNEIPESVAAVGGEVRNGSVVTLSGQGTAASRRHLIANPTMQLLAELHMVKLTLEKPAANVGHLYIRLLIQTDAATIAEVIHGIAKCSYIFDVKINEARNIPTDVLNFKRAHNLSIRPVATAYCLHCVPDNYEISFSDAAKLKNIRRLEKNAFQRYLPCLRHIGGEYTITFIKQRDGSGSYSFFTTFNREVVGNKQLLVAVVISLCCNLLFAFSSFRTGLKPDESWLCQIPVEWWIAVALIVIGLIICLPIGAWLKKIWNWIRKE